MDLLEKKEAFYYQRPMCEVVIFNQSLDVLQSSIEGWGEEDLFGNG